MPFFNLSSGLRDDPFAVYGVHKWKEDYAEAYWGDGVGLQTVYCPVDPGHQRSGDRTTDLNVILTSDRVGDFVWTAYSECLVTDRVLKMLQDSEFTGFQPRSVHIAGVDRRPGSRPFDPPPSYGNSRLEVAVGERTRTRVST